MTDLSEAVRILADHVQMPSSERERINAILGIKDQAESAAEEEKPKAKRKAA